MCIAVLTSEWVPVWSTAVQEFLAGIILEELTTIPFPHTYV